MKSSRSRCTRRRRSCPGWSRPTCSAAKPGAGSTTTSAGRRGRVARGRVGRLMRLGPIGIWSGAFRSDAPDLDEAVRELEDLGFGALWVPGGMGGDVFGISSRLLTSTGHVVVATGVLNVWAHQAVDVGEA